MIVSSHINIWFTFDKYVYIKKFPTFANLLMEKPGNWFAVAKKWE